MTVSKNKNTVKLRAFIIENEDIKKKTSELLKLLTKKLKDTNIRERSMPLNLDDPNHEEDLISDFKINNTIGISGTILRLIDGDGVASIPNDWLENEKIPISELNSLNVKDSKIYKDYFYFYLNNKFLVTNMTGTYTIKRIQVYLNWLLEDERGKFFFELTPKIEIKKAMTLKDVQAVKISDQSMKIPTKGEQNVETKKINGISWELIKDLITDQKSAKELALEQVISAELFIKFKKPKGMDNEKYQKILGATLKPISDTENIRFTQKSGGTVTGAEIEKKKIVSIETTESKRLSEPDLFQAMELFLKELENEKLN